MITCFGCNTPTDNRDIFYLSAVPYCPLCTIKVADLRIAKEKDRPTTMLWYVVGLLRRNELLNSAQYVEDEIIRVFGNVG